MHYIYCDQRVELIVPCLTTQQQREVPILLKSVLFHSQASLINLNVVTTPQGRLTMGTLFSTWELKFGSTFLP